MTARDLPTDIFRDPSRATRTLRSLAEAYMRSGSPHPAEDFFTPLHEQLRVSPDPDLALAHLARFAEAAFSTTSLFSDLTRYPLFLDLLVRLFGHSSYFADILVREPALFGWLTAEGALQKPLKLHHVEEETARSARMFRQPERQLGALKRIHRREILRIGARDLLGLDVTADTTAQLSALADAIVQGALSIVAGQTREKFGSAPDAPFAVLGLGKLGGGELNYSSDIDILFVYGEEGDLSGERPATYHAYFNLLAEQLVRALSTPTSEGHLYRVDTRLRPESGAGPLARSLRSYLVYYEARGEIWERQMLIKARHVAGDQSLGAAFIAQLEPFVYPRTSLQHPVDAIARIKARIEAAVGDEENIKLQSGGIRDIEFLVQGLQLINGGKNREVRSANTLDALRRLGKAALLSGQEEETLTSSYIFYRTLEHRLQMVLNTQTHVVPRDAVALQMLARRMGFSDADQFRRVHAERLRQVRAIFDRVFAVRPPSEADGLLAVLEGGMDDETMRRLFSAHGLHDIRSAVRNVRILLSGSSLTGARELDTRARDAFRAVAVPLFSGITASPVPDLTLKNVTVIAAAQKFPSQFYVQLADPQFRNFLLSVCAVSPRFVRVLAQEPLLLEMLASNIAALAGDDFPFLPPTDDLHALKVHREVLSGLRHLFGFTTFDQLTRELTQLADFIVRTLLDQNDVAKRRPQGSLAVFALGKYGTRELTFDADLDMVFVSGAVTPRSKSMLEGRAAGVISRITGISERGALYGVDVRLRPEGRNAPLVAERGAYLRYLRERASLWERQALTRIRFVGGERTLGEDVMQSVDRFVYEAPLPPGWVDDVVAMRKKMESRTRFHGSAPADIKLGAGGMADVEFAMQMIQLREGRRQAQVRHMSVSEMLREVETALATQEELSLLRDAYTLYRRLEKHMRITLEERGSLLPEGEKLELLARVSERMEGKELPPLVAERMKRVRSVFLLIAGRCGRS